MEHFCSWLEALARRSMVACLFALAVGASGCGNRLGPVMKPSPSTGEPSIVDPESPSAPPVTASWGGRLDRAPVVTRDGIDAVIENRREEMVSVDLELTGSGLGPESITTRLPPIVLQGRERRVVHIDLRSLPVQSVGGPASIVLSGTSRANEWGERPLAPISVFAQLSHGFDTLFASTTSAWTPAALAFVNGDLHDPRLIYLLEPDELARLASEKLVPAGALRAQTGARGAKRDLGGIPPQVFYDELVVPFLHPVGRIWGPDGPIVYRPDPDDLRLSPRPPIPEHVVVIIEDLRSDIRFPRPELHFTKRVCTTWSGYFVDARFGDYLARSGIQRIGAAYTFAQLRSLAQGDVWIGQLDGNGCTPRLALDSGDYLLAQYAKVEERGVRFEVKYEGESHPIQFYWSSLRINNDSPSDATIELTLDDPPSRVMTVATQMLTVPDLGFIPGTTFRVNISTGTCDGVGAWGGTSMCFGNDPQGGPHTTASKYTIAHEIGHGVQEAGAGLPFANYNPQLNIPACRCDHVRYANRLHCMQSVELQSAAIVEGFAHFIAALTFNDRRQRDCTFGYYKEILGDDGRVLPPPVGLDCSGPVRWMRNHGCVPRDQPGGVEWDWLNFLWNLHTAGANGLTMPETFALQRRACGGVSCTNVNLLWSKLRQAAEEIYGVSSPKAQRMRELGQTYGVDQ